MPSRSRQTKTMKGFLMHGIISGEALANLISHNRKLNRNQKTVHQLLQLQLLWTIKIVNLYLMLLSPQFRTLVHQARQVLQSILQLNPKLQLILQLNPKLQLLLQFNHRIHQQISPWHQLLHQHQWFHKIKNSKFPNPSRLSHLNLKLQSCLLIVSPQQRPQKQQ